MADSTGDARPASGGEGRRKAPFLQRALTVLLLVVLTAVVLLFLVQGIGILLSAFAGILFAILLRAIMRGAKRIVPMSDGVALTVVLLLLVGALGVGGWLLAPQVNEQADELAERIPEIVGQIEDYLDERPWGRWLLQQAGGQSDAQAQARSRPDEDAVGGDNGGLPLPVDATGPIGGLLGVLSTWSTYFLTALFVGLFAAANPSLYRDGFLHMLPLRHRARTGDVLDRIEYTLRWWLIGQLAAMVLIGVSTTIVLWIFGVPLAIILGLIVGLLGFIPYLGPILGFVPVVLIAATQDIQTLAYVALAYAGVQLLEGYVATPLIHQGTVHLPPATTLAIQMLMGAVIGVIGIVLATPVAAVLLVLSQFYRSDILDDPAARPED